MIAYKSIIVSASFSRIIFETHKHLEPNTLSQIHHLKTDLNWELHGIRRVGRSFIFSASSQVNNCLFVGLLEMFSESFVSSFFSHCSYPRLQLLPTRNYLGTQGVVYNIKIDRLFLNQDTYVFKESSNFIRKVAYFEACLFLSLLPLITFESELFLYPSERFVKSIVLSPLKWLHGDLDGSMLLHTSKPNNRKNSQQSACKHRSDC